MLELNMGECIEESKKIINGEQAKYESIMNAPTLNHIGLYSQMKGVWDSYLGVVGSFAPSLDAICHGSKNITAFDINPLNILHSYLIIAAILKLEYDDFLKFILYSQEESFYSKYYFEQLKEELPYEVRNYWEYIISFCSKDPNYISLFYNESFLRKESNMFLKGMLLTNNLYLQKENFYLLKKKLKEVKITFLLENFGDIPKVLNGKQFDKIYLSCLNQYIYDNVDGYNYFDKLKEYRFLVKPNGVMEGAYIYDRYRNLDEKYTDDFAQRIPMEKVPVRTLNCYEGKYDMAYLYHKK